LHFQKVCCFISINTFNLKFTIFKWLFKFYFVNNKKCDAGIYCSILHIVNVAGASDVYGKIDVSNPAILGGQVTFAITLNRTCSNYTGKYNWQYTLQNIKQVFYPEDNVIIIENTTGKVNTTYTLTLMNATSTYHKTNISFYCDSGVLVDTVTLDLIGKQNHHNVCMCRK